MPEPDKPSPAFPPGSKALVVHDGNNTPYDTWKSSYPFAVWLHASKLVDPASVPANTTYVIVVTKDMSEDTRARIIEILRHLSLLKGAIKASTLSHAESFIRMVRHRFPVEPKKAASGRPPADPVKAAADAQTMTCREFYATYGDQNPPRAIDEAEYLHRLSRGKWDVATLESKISVHRSGHSNGRNADGRKNYQFGGLTAKSLLGFPTPAKIDTLSSSSPEAAEAVIQALHEANRQLIEKGKRLERENHGLKEANEALIAEVAALKARLAGKPKKK